MTFKDLEIIQPILDAIAEEGYETPSPIQTQAMPIIFSGRDILASAQTGTGKTAAFAIPIIQSIYLNKNPETKGSIKALVLSPTRELAEQIKTSFRTYGSKINTKVGAIYGGVSQKGQESMLFKGIDILVATPGRLIDLMKQHKVRLNDVKYFVLDEADTLLDMGFINDVKYIKGFIQKERQSMMFSATISKEIASLSNIILTDPVKLELAPETFMLDTINHSMFFANKNKKNELLLDLLTDSKLESVLVFTRTKRGANQLVNFLLEYGLKVDAIHGNKSQAKRQVALNSFKTKQTRVLVATDIAARGIDIDDLSHVINYDLPENGETYVHRIGRTGRRGLTGEAISFVDKNEVGLLKAIQKYTGLSLKVLKLEPVSEDSKFKKVVEGFTPQMDDIVGGIEVSKVKSNSKPKYKQSSSKSPRDFKKNFSDNGAKDSTFKEHQYHTNNEELKIGAKDFGNQTTSPKREYHHHDNEGVRKNNFHNYSEHPNSNFENKLVEEKQDSINAFSQSKSRQSNRWNEGNRAADFKDKPSLVRSPKRVDDAPVMVEVGEKELHSKNVFRPFSKASENKPVRSYSRNTEGKPSRSYGRNSEDKSSAFQNDKNEGFKKSYRPFEKSGEEKPSSGSFTRNNEDKPVRSYLRNTEGRPARPFAGNTEGRPARPYSRNTEGRPARPFAGNTEGRPSSRSYSKSSEEPSRSFGRNIEGKPSYRSYARNTEGSSTSSPYSNKTTGGRSFDRKPAGRSPKSNYRGK